MNKLLLGSLVAFLAICAVILWYNFGPLPAAWTPKARTEKAAAEMVEKDFKQAGDHMKGYMEIIDIYEKKRNVVRGKYDLQRDSNRNLSDEQSKAEDEEIKAINVEVDQALKAYDAKWKYDHPN